MNAGMQRIYQRKGDKMETCRIAVYSEESHVRLALEIIFRKNGYGVHLVPNGRNFSCILPEIMRTGENMDLMIIDSSVSIYRQRQIFKALRNQSFFMPVILMTPDASFDQEILMQMQFHVDVIEKPIEPRQLLNQVDRTIRKSKNEVMGGGFG